MLLYLSRFGFFLLKLIQPLVEVGQATGAVVDLFDSVRLVVLLRKLVEPILPLRLVSMQVPADFRLPLDLGLRVLQLLLEVDQEVGVADLLEAPLQPRVLTHEICHRLVGVDDLLLCSLDAH